jgi:predicted DNA-binding protein (UPF0251 family)
MYRKNTAQKSFNLISSSYTSQELSSQIVYYQNYSQEQNIVNLDINSNSIGAINKQNFDSIPIYILKNNSSLEAIVLYMKDILSMRFNQISRALNRDQRTIWVTYSKAKKKIISFNSISNNDGSNSTYPGYSSNLDNNLELNIPLEVFISRKYSILESIVLYLKENHALSFNEISEILGKNYRTIWTIYRRAIKKVDERI